MDLYSIKWYEQDGCVYQVDGYQAADVADVVDYAIRCGAVSEPEVFITTYGDDNE